MTAYQESWAWLGGAIVVMAALFFTPALVTVAPDDQSQDGLTHLSTELGCENGAPNRLFSRAYRPVSSPWGRWHAVDRLLCRDVAKARNHIVRMVAKSARTAILNLALNQEISQAREAYAAAKNAEEEALLKAEQATDAEQAALKRVSELTAFAQTQEQTIDRQAASLRGEAAQNAQLRTDLTQITLDLSRSQQDLIKARNLQAFAEQQVTQAETAQGDLREDLTAAAEAENSDLRGQNTALQARLLDMTAEWQALQTQLAQAQTHLLQRDQALDAQRAALDALALRLAKNQDELAQTLQALGVAESALHLQGGTAERVQQLAALESVLVALDQWDDLRLTLSQPPYDGFGQQRASLVLPQGMFADGRAEFRDAAIPALNELAAALKDVSDQWADKDTGTFLIRGHGDATPIATAPFPSNWALSVARAAHVARYLVAQGVPANRVQVTGQSDGQPPEPNQSARRVTIEFIPHLGQDMIR